jgi:hypothetical protein
MLQNLRLVIVLLVAILIAKTGFAHSQGQPTPLPTEISGIRFDSGQSVVPYFEGWIRNPDGTFDLVFGYFNRNWKQELAIPTGPNNKVEPGGPDAGQPTYFLPRQQRWMFRVRVPADFGKGEVTWTITANGRTEKAYGTLLQAEEISDRVVMSNGGYDPGRDDPNEPPSIKIASPQTATVGAPVTLTAIVTDDGLPKPRPVSSAARPTTTTGAFGAQVNSSGGTRPRGLTVSWSQVRGPAKVNFEKTGTIPVTNGQAATNVQFSQPGTYHLRVRANDGALSRTFDVIVTVQ